ncbi:hypothetical protein BDV3_003273 [Batrachochytrium dendrobatidis]
MDRELLSSLTADDPLLNEQLHVHTDSDTFSTTSSHPTSDVISVHQLIQPVLSEQQPLQNNTIVVNDQNHILDLTLDTASDTTSNDIHSQTSVVSDTVQLLPNENQVNPSQTHSQTVADQVAQVYGLLNNSLQQAASSSTPSRRVLYPATSQVESDFQSSVRQSTKRKAIDVRDHNSPATTSFVSPPQESATECPICIEGCTSFGPHRIVAFKCGHLFGKSCIVKWIESARKGQKATCPTCKKPITKQNMVHIFTKNVVAIDSVERDTALAEASKYQKENLKLMAHNQTLLNQVQQLCLLRDAYKRNLDEVQVELFRGMGQVEQLKQELKDLKRKNLSSHMACSSMDNVAEIGMQNTRVKAFDMSSLVFSLTSILDIPSEKSTSRTIQICEKTSILFVSLKHTQNNDAHGILKINLNDTNRRQFYPIHAQTIRDFKLSCKENGLLLSTSHDKTLKLSSFESCTVLQTFQLDSPGWSCCFDSHIETCVYVGTSKNEIMQFDTRVGHMGALQRISLSFSRGKGVHSLYCGAMIPPVQDSQTNTMHRSTLTKSVVETIEHPIEPAVYLYGGTFDDIFAIPLIDPSQSIVSVNPSLSILPLPYPLAFGECITSNVSDDTSESLHPMVATSTCMIYDVATQVWAATLRPATGGTVYRIGRVVQSIGDVAYTKSRDIWVPDPQRTMTRIHFCQLGTDNLLISNHQTESMPQKEQSDILDSARLALVVGNEALGNVTLWDTRLPSVSPAQIITMHPFIAPMMDIKSARDGHGNRVMLFGLSDHHIHMWATDVS